MNVTVQCKLKSYTSKVKSDVVSIECSEEDADWIKELTLALGANCHPTAELPDGTYTSLARQVLQRHGVPVENESHVYRYDVSEPMNVAHDNLCIPLDLLPRRDCLDGVRSIVFADWRKIFEIDRNNPILPSVNIQCLNMDTFTPITFLGDNNDQEWLEGKQVKFSPKGAPLVSMDGSKFIPITAEQARRHMPTVTRPMIRRLAPSDPLDIRKHLVLTIGESGRMWTGMIIPR